MANQTALSIIHESLINGQRKQMVNQTNEYGLYDFWVDYKEYLSDNQPISRTEYNYFCDAVISYHRITNR